MKGDLVIIGGNAAGMKAAARARRVNPNLAITVFEEGNYVSFAGCGLPYYVSGLIEEPDDLVMRKPEWFKKYLNLTVHTNHRVEKIDRKTKSITVRDLAKDQTLQATYRKLIIATGSTPIKPDIPGINLPNIFTAKSLEDGTKIREHAEKRKPRSAVIVGAGLIGLEMAESLTSLNIRVTVIEKLGQILSILDYDVAFLVQKYLNHKGIQLHLEETVTRFNGDEETGVTSVTTDKRTLNADLAIVSIGARPNTTLAKEAGLALGPTGAIQVNPKMYTSDPDILAAGDCAEATDCVTGRPVWAPLGSTANKQGRVAGENAAGGEAEFGGVLPVQIAKLFDLTVAKAGLSETEAVKLGLDPEITFTNNWDHPQYYPGARMITMKTVTNRRDHRILGCQIVGERGVDKRIDVMATAIYKGMTCDDLTKLDLAYAPPYSPALDPVIVSGNVTLNKLNGLFQAINGRELLQRLRNGEKLQLVDVAPPKMYREIHIPGSIHIPLNELWTRAPRELDRDKETVAVCRYGITSYHAARFLKDRLGFKDVKSLEGGVTVWQGPTESSE